MRLSEMSDPRTFPALERCIGTAVRARGVALEQEDTPTAPREPKRRREPRETTACDYYVR